MEFIKGGATLPVPLNTIPTPKSVYYIFKKLLKLVCCFRDMKSKSNDLTRRSNTNELPTISGNNAFKANNLNHKYNV